MNASDYPVRVLVAEDDEDHLFLTMRALRSVPGVHLEVEGVRDGVEVLDYVHQRGEFADRPRPDLILLDIRMPRMDGLAALAEIKANPELETIPVVMLTSSERVEDVTTAYQSGTNSYVSKSRGSANLRSVASYWTRDSILPPR